MLLIYVLSSSIEKKNYASRTRLSPNLWLLRLSETKAKKESKVICIICQMASGDVPRCLARRVSPLITGMNKAWIPLSWEVLAMIFDKNLHTITRSCSNYVSGVAHVTGIRWVVEGQGGTSHTLGDLLKIAKLYCCLKKKKPATTVLFDSRGSL